MARLLWGLRTYRWAAVLAVVLVVLVVLVAEQLTPSPRRYEATAVVTARSLAILPAQLPRLAETIFEHGEVLEEAARDPLSPFTAEQLASRVDLEPVEENVALLVVGHADVAADAAGAANAVAAATVDALNRMGPGIGVFTLHTEAATPTDPVEGPSRTLIAGAAAVAAALFALGLLGLLVTWQDPILTPDDATEAVKAPLVGTLRIRDAESLDVAGLPELVGRLFADRRGTYRFVDVGADGQQSSGSLVARALQVSGPVVYVAERDPTRPGEHELDAVPTLERRPAHDADPPVVVASSDDTVLRGPATIVEVPAVIVVRRGTAAEEARAVRRRLPDEHVAGVVFVAG